MNEDKKQDDIPYLQRQINDYKRERDHFLETCLNLQTKLESMKQLEVNLRHEIYQLKHNRMGHENEQKDDDEKKWTDPMTNKWDQLNNNQVTIKHMLQDYIQTSQDHGYSRQIVGSLTDLNSLLEEVRDILKKSRVSPSHSMTNADAKMTHLLDIMQPYRMNNFIFNHVQEEPVRIST